MIETVTLVRDVGWCDQNGVVHGKTTETVEVTIDWRDKKPNPQNYTYAIVGEWRIIERSR